MIYSNNNSLAYMTIETSLNYNTIQVPQAASKIPIMNKTNFRIIIVSILLI